MRVEYNRRACTGWFQCVQKWDALEMNMMAGKADLPSGEETEDEVFVVEVDGAEAEAAIDAAEACPVDAIAVYDDGEQVAPES